MPDTQLAVDISNWQGNLPPDVYAAFLREGAKTIVLGTSGNPQAPLVYEDQAVRAMNAGLEVEAYVWLTWDTQQAMTDRINGKLDLVQRCPWVRRVWLDCEEQTNLPVPADVVSAIALARDLVKARGLEVGIYTGAWWWKPSTDNDAGFWDLPLWLADYDGQATLESRLLPLGGWGTLYRKQYTDKGTLGGIYPLDLDVELATPHSPTPPPALDDFQRGRLEMYLGIKKLIDELPGPWGIPV